MKTIYVTAIVAVIFYPSALTAQHHHMEAEMKHDSTMRMRGMPMDAPMSHAYSLSLPMQRDGSGTGWMPDSSVMYGYGWMTKKWMFMLHYNLFLRYDNQDIANAGIRGAKKYDAPNWVMGMGQRQVGKNGLFHFSGMFSLDPFTEGEEGYPLLFQTGESHHDFQHAHDLVSELSVGYTQRFTREVDLSFYFAYPGEPALGPVAYMHRLSALNNPDAPLAHHWQDGTHTTYGVATIGLRVNILKVEGSVFNGREPDNERFVFDPLQLNSYSIRILCNPNSTLAIQVSQALLIAPEAAHPEVNITRTTASVIHHLPFVGKNRYLATTLAWGFNNTDLTEEHSILIEPNVQLNRLAIYARYEWVQKDAEELHLAEYRPTAVFNIQAFTLGTNITPLRPYGSNVSLGIQGTVFAAPDLKAIYGNYPVSLEIYIRLWPEFMRMHHV